MLKIRYYLYNEFYVYKIIKMAQRLYFRKETTSFIKQFNFLAWIIENRRSAGVVLGPLLFLPFINDIVYDIQSFVRLFADDSSLIFSSTNPLEVEDKSSSFR